MKLSLAWRSLLLFGLSVSFLLGLTLFESALVGMSAGAERMVSLFLLVLTPTIGAILGVLSLQRKEGLGWLAVSGIVLNTFFGLFHLIVLGFAG